MPLDIVIRRLGRDDWRDAFPIVSQLRSHLNEDEFIGRVTMQYARGYQLYGAYIESSLVGVLGMRPVSTLARARHFHVDDLVVDREQRGSGIGVALLERAEREAAKQGAGALFLDSRRDVLDWYRHRGYETHTSTLMRKRISN